MDLNIHPPLPAKKDFRIGILGSGGLMFKSMGAIKILYS